MYLQNGKCQIFERHPTIEQKSFKLDHSFYNNVVQEYLKVLVLYYCILYLLTCERHPSTPPRDFKCKDFYIVINRKNLTERAGPKKSVRGFC